MRQIALSIKTSGPLTMGGDRIVEVGAVELADHRISERNVYSYINPGKALCPSEEAVLGFSNAFLIDKPVFGAVAADLLNFVRGSRLLVYDAPFHMGFLNAELDLLELPPLDVSIQCVVDIRKKALIMFSDEEACLDALCSRYKIEMPSSTSRSALDDARIFGQIYLGMSELSRE